MFIFLFFYKFNCFYLYVYFICRYLLIVCRGEGDARFGEVVRWIGFFGVFFIENRK